MSLAGSLDELALPDILQIVSLSEKTGRLTLTSKDGEGLIVFRKGRIIYAASNSAREVLGNILVCKKMIDEEMLKKALLKQHRSHEERRLGTILVEMGVLRREDLEQIIQQQVEKVVGVLFGWREGFFKFEPLEIADRGEIEVDAREFLTEQGLNAHKVALDLTRVADERRKQMSVTAEATVRTVELTAGPPPTTTLHDVICDQPGPALTAEVTLEIIAAARRFLERGVLFLIERNGAAGIGQFGLQDDGTPGDERVRTLWMPADEPSVVTDVVSSGRTYRGPMLRLLFNETLITTVGGNWPADVAVLPVKARDAVAAVLYGDNQATGAAIANLEPLERLLEECGARMAGASGRLRASGARPEAMPDGTVTAF